MSIDHLAKHSALGIHPATPLSTSLHLALYRAYDPVLGMWLNEDPLEEEGGLNLYQYALNNPLMFYAPDGRSPAWAFPPELSGGAGENADFKAGFQDGINKSIPAGLAICAVAAGGAGFLGPAVETAVGNAATGAVTALTTGAIKNGIKEAKKPDGSLSKACRNTVADTAAGALAGVLLGPVGKRAAAIAGAVAGGILVE